MTLRDSARSRAGLQLARKTSNRVLIFEHIMLFVTLFKRAARCGAVAFAGVAAGWLFEACAGSPPSAAAPSPVVRTQSALNLAGTWTGSGSDGLGSETFTWVVVFALQRKRFV